MGVEGSWATTRYQETDAPDFALLLG